MSGKDAALGLQHPQANACTGPSPAAAGCVGWGCRAQPGCSLSRAEVRLVHVPDHLPGATHGAAALTAPGVQVKFCDGIWSSRDRTEFRKLGRIPMTIRLSSSGGKVEGDESWGMMLPPTRFTAPCEER